MGGRDPQGCTAFSTNKYMCFYAQNICRAAGTLALQQWAKGQGQHQINKGLAETGRRQAKEELKPMRHCIQQWAQIKAGAGMKFLLIFAKKSVPEWKECYYDYAALKALVVLAKEAYAIKCNIQELQASEQDPELQEHQQLANNPEQLLHSRTQTINRLDAAVSQINEHFYTYHSTSKRVVFLFCQYKIHELTARLSNYIDWEPDVAETKADLLSLMGNCYAQDIRLENLARLHLQAYERIYKKHDSVFRLFGLTTPSLNSARLLRTIDDLGRYSQQVEQAMGDQVAVKDRENRFQMEQEKEPSPFQVSAVSYLFGLCNGFSISVIITAIILLGINVTNDDTNRISVKFLNEYRLWKSLGFVILYIWVFGISFYIFERKLINYHLIFDYNSKKPKSTSRLGMATFITLLWSGFFIFYVLDLLEIYQVGNVSADPEIPITIYFPVILFGLFLLEIVVSFLRTRRGVVFFFFTMLKIIMTPFGFFSITFGVIWATEQVLSLVQVIFDLSYSVCYYARLLKAPHSLENPCMDLIVIAEAMVIFVYGVRFMQIIRLSVQNQRFLGTREMYRSFRAILHIIIAVLSLVSNRDSYAILWVWVAVSLVCVVYSFVIDLLLDWNHYLLQRGSDGRITLTRREQNIFSLSILRGMVIYDMICRVSYVFTICPKLVFTYIPHAEVISTVAGVIEMTRRLIWNVLRVENEQVKNNYYFQIRTDYEEKEKRIKGELQAKGVAIKEPKLEEVQRSAQELENLREHIRIKNEKREKVIRFLAETDALLKRIQLQSEHQALPAAQS